MSSNSREDWLHLRRDACCQEEGWSTSPLLLFLDRLFSVLAAYYFIYRYVCTVYGWDLSPKHWPGGILWPTLASLSTAVIPAVVLILHPTVLEYDKRIAYS